MKTQTVKTLGLAVALSVPSTVEEFDLNAKRAGACLDEATKNVLYRGSLAELRDLILHGRDEEKEGDKVIVAAFKGLDVLTGIDRKVKKVKTGKENKEVEVYDETEEKFFDRICAEKNVKPESFQSHFDAAAALVEFDASARERKVAGPKKLPEKYKTLATEFLTGAINPATKKPRNLDGFLAAAKKQLDKNYTKTGDTEKDTVALGWLLKEFADAQDVFAKMS